MRNEICAAFVYYISIHYAVSKSIDRTWIPGDLERAFRKLYIAFFAVRVPKRLSFSMHYTRKFKTKFSALCMLCRMTSRIFGICCAMNAEHDKWLLERLHTIHENGWTPFISKCIGIFSNCRPPEMDVESSLFRLLKFNLKLQVYFLDRSHRRFALYSPEAFTLRSNDGCRQYISSIRFCHSHIQFQVLRSSFQHRLGLTTCY